MIVTVAVDVPIRQAFDYTIDEKVLNAAEIVGRRVRVPLGHSTRIGVVIKATETKLEFEQSLKSVDEILDSESLFPPLLLQLLNWSARYYKHPVGEVYANALPALLRQGLPAKLSDVDCWRCSDIAPDKALEALARAPKQTTLYEILASTPHGLSAEQISQSTAQWRQPLKELCRKGLVEQFQSTPLPPPQQAPLAGPPLNIEQQQAVDSIVRKLDDCLVYLLSGVTGSGKTEVYLSVIEQIVADNKQALILVPEIGLTGQLVTRFRRRFGVPVVALHSGLNDRQRLDAWLLARRGDAAIIIGTRSAVFVPTTNLGVIIVDEEHDLSFKQQDGFRYHARDIAVKRAQAEKIPVILGSATPSLESLHNVQRQHYELLQLTQRAGVAVLPSIHLVDARHQKMTGALTPVLLSRIRAHLEQGQQVLLFLNRRGYAPVLLCHACGYISRCRGCDRFMTYHRQRHRLICHQCQNEYPVPSNCPTCGGREFVHIGAGTERIEAALSEHFPNKTVVRIDRDSTRGKGELQRKLDDIERGDIDIVIGTQMITKGHDFPNITLVGILDTDQSLFSLDFRAHERMAQLMCQVSGRAGRADKTGEVLIQTHHPDHPLFQTVLKADYGNFAAVALEERRAYQLPPVAAFALMRVESTNVERAQVFLNDVVDLVGRENGGVRVMGPVPAPIERRAGRFRFQLLFQAAQRAIVQRFLDDWIIDIERIKSARKVRWSIDVDPMELT